MWNFPLFPEQASSNAVRVDSLFFFELAIVFFFTTLICVLILSFAARYRAGSNVQPLSPPPLEPPAGSDLDRYSPDPLARDVCLGDCPLL